jgi:hypothetical protein
MTKFRTIAVLWLSASRVIAGDDPGTAGEVASADVGLRPQGAHLTLGASLHIADVAASKHGLSISDMRRTFWYKCKSKESCVWQIDYCRSPAGECTPRFMIFVNDRTKRADLSPHIGPMK